MQILSSNFYLPCIKKPNKDVEKAIKNPRTGKGFFTSGLTSAFYVLGRRRVTKCPQTDSSVLLILFWTSECSGGYSS